MVNAIVHSMHLVHYRNTCHFIKRKNPEMPQCHLCQHVFLTEKNLNIHLDSCEAPCKCWLCEKSFSSKSSLEQHFNKCSKSKFACLFCEYRCITDGQLQDHIQRNHSDQPTFSCSKCPNVYGTNDKLMSHIQMCHADILVGPLFSEGKSH